MTNPTPAATTASATIAARPALGAISRIGGRSIFSLRFSIVSPSYRSDTGIELAITEERAGANTWRRTSVLEMRRAGFVRFKPRQGGKCCEVRHMRPGLRQLRRGQTSQGAGASDG